MDDTDRKLISALRHNARASLSELSQKLGISRTTVRSRIDRLQKSGEIVGFTVVLKSETLVDPIRGLMLLGIEGRGTDKILRQLTGISAVTSVHSTNGRWDMIAEIGTQTLSELDEVLAQIRRIDGVHSSETNLLLGVKKSAR